jgi:hypothetical protein
MSRSSYCSDDIFAVLVHLDADGTARIPLMHLNVTTQPLG